MAELTMSVGAQQATRGAAQQSVQPATPQLTGHALSAETHAVATISSTSLYNSSTGQYSHRGGTSVERSTEIHVRNLVCDSSQIHKQVQVGKNYAVNIETDKHGVLV